MDDAMTLHLRGAEGQMDPRALQRGLGWMLDLLDGPRGAQQPRGSFVVSDLKIGSSIVAVKPRDSDPVALSSIERAWQGIGHLRESPGIPADWDRRMVEHLVALCGITSLRGVDGAELLRADSTPLHLDATVLRHAEQSLAPHRTSLGSVRGRLDRWNERGARREVGLVDEITGRAITVQVPQHLESRVVDALRRTVLAWGLVDRSPVGEKVGLTMEDFEVVADVPHASVENMVGFLGDWTDGQSSVDWVREQRAG